MAIFRQLRGLAICHPDLTCSAGWRGFLVKEIASKMKSRTASPSPRASTIRLRVLASFDFAWVR
jgi:hypothetical protein